jgi:hypothetical protein
MSHSCTFHLSRRLTAARPSAMESDGVSSALRRTVRLPAGAPALYALERRQQARDRHVDAGWIGADSTQVSADQKGGKARAC